MTAEPQFIPLRDLYFCEECQGAINTGTACFKCGTTAHIIHLGALIGGAPPAGRPQIQPQGDFILPETRLCLAAADRE